MQKLNFYIGLDIGGSKMKGVLMKDEKALKFFEFRYDNKKVTVKELKDFMIRGIESLDAPLEEIRAIGLALPCPIIDGQPYHFHINPALENFSVIDFLTKKYKTPVYFENDCNLAALGEWYFGWKAKPESLFLINLGTGCGSGFVKQGNLMRGGRTSAFEFGHMDMGQGNNWQCLCGDYDHVECYISSQFFRLRGLASFEEAKKARNGNKKSLSLFKEYGGHLGWATANIINLLEPNKIILTGGLSSLHSLYLNQANKICRSKIFFKKISSEFDKIKIAKTGANATVLGAALWAIRNCTEKDIAQKSGAVRKVSC